jgi:hypothetical protein
MILSCRLPGKGATWPFRSAGTAILTAWAGASIGFCPVGESAHTCANCQNDFVNQKGAPHRGGWTHYLSEAKMAFISGKVLAKKNMLAAQ